MTPQNVSPRVSVVIIFLNPGWFLEEAINSVLAQTLTDWELILVDDGSNDASSQIALDAVQSEPNRICYLEHPGHVNLGTSASRNLGLEKARGEYLLYLDADDILFTDTLMVLSEQLERASDVAAAFGTTLWWNWAPEYSNSTDQLQSFRRCVGRMEPPRMLAAMVANEDYHPATCSSLFRRTILLELGGFELEFRGMYEDTVMLAKVMLIHPVLVSDKPLSAYRMHPASQCHRAMDDGSFDRFKPNVARGRYLRWLETHIRAKKVTDARLFWTLRRQLWAYDHPFLFRLANSYKLRMLIRRALALYRWVSRNQGAVHPSVDGSDLERHSAETASQALAIALEAQGRIEAAQELRKRAPV